MQKQPVFHSSLPTPSSSASDVFLRNFTTRQDILFIDIPTLFALKMNQIGTTLRRLASGSGSRKEVSHWFLATSGTPDSVTAVADSADAVSKVAHSKTQEEPLVTVPGQAFGGDYRSTSGLGVGDGLSNHTAKWWQPELGVRRRSFLSKGCPF